MFCGWGIIVSQKRANGIRTEVRFMYDSACAADTGRALQTDCWEALDQSPRLDIARIGHEAVTFFTIV